VFSAAAILVALWLAAAPCAAQDAPADSLAEYFTFPDPSPFACLFTLFPPALIAHGNELKEFVRSDAFAHIRAVLGDARAVDAVFVKAMQLTDNNTGIALLMSAVATFDHDIVGVKVPALSIVFPLTSESTEEFVARRDRLPAHFYGDSPPGASGDRDKLQHFFGSAFLTFTLESPSAAGRFGDFVERGEDAIIVGGVLDERDIRANRQGQLFGVALLDDNRRYPSEFLRIVIAAEPAGSLSPTGER
jgi:hypothetical protein